MLTEHELARRALGAIPGFAADASSAQITRLKALTNRVYKVVTASGSFCLRIPGEGTAVFIDRRAEEANARAAAEAGIAPAVLHFGPDGVMATRFIDGATLSPERFRDNPGPLQRTAQALRRLHDDVPSFSRDFHVFEIMQGYAKLLKKSGVVPRSDHLDLVDRAQAARCALEENPVPWRPCHCDPTGANLIDTRARIWIVDWEYSAMNDPMWDLAYLSVEAEFDAVFDERLLCEYFARPPRATETARMLIHKALSELLSALWALLQHANGNRSADFSTYAEATFERCRRRMLAPDFTRSLEVVRNG